MSFGDPVPPHLGELPPDIATHFPHGTDAGWRPDPNVAGQLRLWDGRHWTEHVRPLDPVAEEQRTAAPEPDQRGRACLGAHRPADAGPVVVASCVSLLWWIATLNTLQIWSMQPGDVHEDEARSLLRTMILLFLAALLVVWFLSRAFVLVVWIGVSRNDRHMNTRP